PVSMNFEIAYGRGRWPGEYTVNAHLYRSADNRFPVPVTAKVSVQTPDGKVRSILQSTVDMTFVGQETTIFRFTLDDKAGLIPGSVNRVHKDLRSAWKSKTQ